ncbi:SgcJ/EcaC family oxidoreductase [Promicromonospora sukumoe]|uniref:SgcJ/EcaC family oxidoreductase n=1 Tax=Promicromonospora sukumoe TaxID=88382 RepID=UPI0003791D7A|nr:SgcJ/EcaC family oxidoreductase [Promicromonospora sukumoe]
MRTTTPLDEANAVVTTVLDRWKDRVDAHDPEGVAAVFTTDALFQGLRPSHTIGRTGVAEYYAAQPLGMTASFRVLHTRTPSPGTILGYVQLAFAFPDRPTVNVHLTTLLEHHEQEWQIAHYHVSRIE